ncbi:DUF3383 family protein [Achromobacter sp. Marseille-Q0513]|uniref:DUF3383 family protein n=1 Tax=Achromobacter sp. Marseille-Q0513 TaxID=2829161 RepID=UPI001B991CBE|nr:DUF3383 family protein [Achromobacter sp. Marseille-Q0513]MBR8654196.1 DUF3383 family protein [Achromobacter sp. Marseille-Q0513]
MSYPADRIIQVNARISPAGLGFANFAAATIFAAAADVTAGTLAADTRKTYFTMQEVAADFPATTETYKAAAAWLGGTPKMRQVTVWMTKATDLTVTATLNKARDAFWWYWTIFTADVLAVTASVKKIAEWCEANASMLVNSQAGTSAADIRDQNKKSDVASELKTLGYRHVYTAAHATNPHSGVYLAKHFAAVNYSADRSTITGEFKKSPGLAAEDVKGSEIAAMEAKGAAFYSIVEMQGSEDVGRWLNTKTHSTYGEYIDDVVNLDAFINTLTVRLYNALANVTTKLEQTPRGQAVLLATARQVGEQYIANSYLGPRNYVDPDDGIQKYTIGFEILTKPEDILDLSTEDRNGRLAAPIRMRLFRAGAIHKAIIDLDVY